MRLATKPKQLPTTTPTLLRRRPKLEGRRHNLVARLTAAHDFEQLHHVGGAEEVVPDHLRGPPARLGELVDIERRRVGGQHTSGLGHTRKLRERRLLQIHVLEHRFDDDVDVIEAVVGRRGCDERERLGHRLRRQLALGDRRFVVLADRRHAAVQPSLIDVLEEHWDTHIGVRHRDAATHGSRADDRRALDVVSGGVFGDIGNLGHLALGKEHVDRARRDSVDKTQSANSSRSRAEPASKSLVTQASMASTAANGARAPRAVFARVARAASHAASPDGPVTEFVLPVANLAALTRLGARQCEGDRAFEKIAIHDLIDDAFSQRA